MKINNNNIRKFIPYDIIKLDKLNSINKFRFNSIKKVNLSNIKKLSNDIKYKSS